MEVRIYLYIYFMGIYICINSCLYKRVFKIHLSMCICSYMHAYATVLYVGICMSFVYIIIRFLEENLYF